MTTDLLHYADKKLREANKVCLDCGRRNVTLAARGLCKRDYERRRIAGTLNERPPLSARGGGGIADSPLGEGLTYRQMDYWARVGYLQPTDPTPGSGSWRIWPESERQIARTMLRLKAAGLTIETAAWVARAGNSVELAPGIRIEVTP